MAGIDNIPNFFDAVEDDTEKPMRLGSDLLPIKIYLTMMDIAQINSNVPFTKTVILSDGREIDVELYLDVDREAFTKGLRGVITTA